MSQQRTSSRRGKVYQTVNRLGKSFFSIKDLAEYILHVSDVLVDRDPASQFLF